MTQREQLNVIEHAANESRATLISALRAMASANDARDPYTRGHSERVTRFSVAIAENMGLSEEEIERVRIGALIHDIGKITIDDCILNKPSMLTEAEYEVMKTHALNGYEMLKHIPQLKDMASTAKYHHEQLDGKGYPFGLKGEDIPQIVSIVTVADCFDAMTTMRPYQEATPVDRVLDIMREEAGIKFDERAVEALIKAIQSGRIATRIQDKIQTKE